MMISHTKKYWFFLWLDVMAGCHGWKVNSPALKKLLLFILDETPL